VNEELAEGCTHWFCLLNCVQVPGRQPDHASRARSVRVDEVVGMAQVEPEPRSLVGEAHVSLAAATQVSVSLLTRCWFCIEEYVYHRLRLSRSRCPFFLCHWEQRTGGNPKLLAGWGGSRGTSPSLDLTFPPTGLSENLGEWKGEGRERGKGRVGETTCLTSPPPTGFCLKYQPDY